MRMLSIRRNDFIALVHEFIKLHSSIPFAEVWVHSSNFRHPSTVERILFYGQGEIRTRAAFQKPNALASSYGNFLKQICTRMYEQIFLLFVALILYEIFNGPRNVGLIFFIVYNLSEKYIKRSLTRDFQL